MHNSKQQIRSTAAAGQVGWIHMAPSALPSIVVLSRVIPTVYGALFATMHRRTEAHGSMNSPHPNHHLQQYDHDDTSTTNTTSLPSPRHLPCFHAGYYLRSSTKSSYVQIREWCIPTHCVVGLDCGRCGGNNSDGQR